MIPSRIVFSCLVLAACAEQAVERQAPPPPKVTVDKIGFREVTDFIEHTGWLDSAETVEVRSRVRGHLHAIHFKDGQRVGAGDLLFELDPRPFQADIARAKAIVAALEAQRVATEKERARQESLLGRGGASQSLVDKLTADVQAYAAQIAAQEQEVARLDLDLEFSRITSPIAGRIGRAMLTKGNLVNAGGSDPLLTTVVSLDPVYLYFTVDERALQTYRKRHPRPPDDPDTGPKQVPFQFALDTDEGYPRTGTLDFADVKLDPGTGTITLRGTVQNAQGELLPGSRARVRIAVSEPRQAAIVPDRAILADQDRRYLLLVDDKKTVARRDVVLGKLLDDGMREVTPREKDAPAFRAEDVLIVEGLLRARIHQPVDPVPAGGTPR